MAKKQSDLIVIAVHNHNPKEDDDLQIKEIVSSAPDLFAQLPVQRGEKFDVLGRHVGWWLYVQHLGGSGKGYIPSTCVVPLKDNLTNEEQSEVDSGAELTAALINSSVDLKFFPCALTRKQGAGSREPCPEDTANIFSRITFWWITGLIYTGYKRPLTDADLWAINKNKKSAMVVPKFIDKWREAEKRCQGSEKLVTVQTAENNTALLNRKVEMEEHVQFSPNKTKEKGKKPSLSIIMLKLFWRKVLLAIFFKLINDCIQFVQPQILKLLIEYVEDKSNHRKEWQGYMFALGMFSVAAVQSIALHQYFHVVTVLGLKVRTAVIGMVYAKALHLNNCARKESTAGEMVNLMSVDAQRLMDLFMYINIVWSAPLQIIVSLYFLYATMGVSVLAGVTVMLLLIPLNLFVTRIAKKLQVKQMAAKDLRIKLMNEILNGIKVLKMYAWETSFMTKISKLRKEELKHQRNASFLNAWFYFTFMCAPFLVSLATFSIYVLTGNLLTASKAFVAISLFHIIRFPLSMLPNIIITIIQAQVSLKRLTDFLHLEELDPKNVESTMPEHGNSAGFMIHSISIIMCSVIWIYHLILLTGYASRTTDYKDKLIHMNIPGGSLVAVVGQVGCGKSTLLSALLGETEKLAGKVYVKGSVAYVPQQAWIQNATLRDNILFGKTFHGKRYAKVIHTCALQTDLDILPGGDLTEIGEKGINLSGGQKQRVSLARAVYFNADIYLLDDPLSAVDSHVGKHIFDKVIGPKGKLRKKTRVLVTHGVAFLPQMDQIIVLQDGQISEVGTYADLVNNQGAFAEFLSTYATEKQTQLGYDPPVIHVTDEEETEEPDGPMSTEESFDSHLDSLSLPQHEERVSLLTVDTADLDGVCTKSGEVEVDKMIEEETSKTGRVPLSVFWEYIKSLTLVNACCIFTFTLLGESFSITSGIWLAKWSSSNISSSGDRQLFLGVYAALGLAQAFSVFSWAMFFALGAQFASRHLHQRMLVNIMHSPMSFFETTPLGRIVNRFSKDMNGIDQLVPRSVSSSLRTLLNVLASLFSISFATPVFLVVVVPLAVFYIFIQRLFVASSRQLMRIESVSRSPIYNNFLETINGTTTIRAFTQQQRFIQGNYFMVDENQAAYYPTICSNRWLAVRLEFLGNLVIFFAALFAVVSRDSIESGLVGLSVTYALQVTQTLNWMVRMNSEVETNIVAVERVKEYSETPIEADWVIPDNRPPDSWPDAGNIVIEEFDLKYREGLPLVLKNINCDIKPGEKVGIVGRTGAGKSSLTLALFRIVERAGGRILIDGVDIAGIGLQDLRSRLTIIPQDPVLFCGTLRLNLDPFDKHTDEELWTILELSHLKNFVSGLEEGLLHPVSEGGENLSVGQRQLVCLARALLRKTKILVLDEATAAVDLETDHLIQQTIRREFADRTVFTIAHRLNTIMDYTRIMVLDKGFVVEFDTPSNLLVQQGTFYTMAHDAGLA